MQQKSPLLLEAEEIVKFRWGERFKDRKKKLKNKIGFILLDHFGKGCWTLADLNEEQLKEFIVQMYNRIYDLPCCDKHLPKD